MLRLAGSARTMPTVARPSPPEAPARRSASAMSSAAGTSASRRPGMAEPPCDSSPVTSTSYQRWARAWVTIPTLAPSRSSSGPCSMWSSR